VLSAKTAGFSAAFAAYALWGLLPFYMKALAHVPVMEVMAHRAIWSVPVAGVILLCLGRYRDLFHALKSIKILLLAGLTSVLISSNWVTYIWAVVHEHTLDAALGYYINPLFNVLVGALILKERLNRPQWFAVLLAFLAVTLMTFDSGGLPFIALFLPLTFCCYSLLRKSLPIGATQGFMLEVLILFLPACALEGFFIIKGTSLFWGGNLTDPLLLIMAGPFTAIPLILFTLGARALNFITIGLMQYIVPTALFLVAVFVFKEPFSSVQLIAFILIWSGLALYSIAHIKQMRR